MAIIVLELICAFCFTVAALISLLNINIMSLLLFVLTSAAALAMAFFASLDIRDYIKKKQPTFAKLLAACKQKYSHQCFNEKHFPLEPVKSDESEWEVYEYHFDKTFSGISGFEILEALGYRLCGPRRAMEYIAKNPDIQLDHPLIFAACWQHSSSRWYIPIFYGFRGERFSNLCGLDGNFYSNYGWLVLRKKNS